MLKNLGVWDPRFFAITPLHCSFLSCCELQKIPSLPFVLNKDNATYALKHFIYNDFQNFHPGGHVNSDQFKIICRSWVGGWGMNTCWTVIALVSEGLNVLPGYFSTVSSHQSSLHSFSKEHKCKTHSHRKLLPRTDHLLRSLVCIRDNVDSVLIV